MKKRKYGTNRVGWTQAIFTEVDRLAWNREYMRKKRQDPEYRKAKCADVKRVKDSLRDGGCSLCGYRKCITALEFHHVGDDKERAISAIDSVGSVLREASKCIVVCANCHREIHAGQIEGYADVERAAPVREDPPLLQLICGTA
jgi:hypothetical protein